MYLSPKPCVRFFFLSDQLLGKPRRFQSVIVFFNITRRLTTQLILQTEGTIIELGSVIDGNLNQVQRAGLFDI